MKRFTLVIAVLCMVALFGCAKKQSSEALKNLDFGKAPTLGPVYKKFMSAVIDKDWDTAWNCMSSKMQKSMEEGLKSAKEVDVEALKKSKAEEEAQLATAPAEGKPLIENSIKALDKQIAECEKVKTMDVKAYFAYLFGGSDSDTDTPRAQLLDDLSKKKYEIVKEEIDGDNGKIIQKEDGKDNELTFVKENGEWKCSSK